MEALVTHKSSTHSLQEIGESIDAPASAYRRLTTDGQVQHPLGLPLSSRSHAAQACIVMQRLFLFICIIFSAPLEAGWIVLPDLPRLLYSHEEAKGYSSLEDALAHLSNSGRIKTLDGILASDLLQDDTFQNELFAALEQHAPHELKEALASAGNMHNPKMHPLRKPFLQSILVTPTVRKFNAELAPFSRHVSSASLEKLELRKVPSGRRFFCILWLNITQIP